MPLVNYLRNATFAITALTALLFTFYTVANLMLFLSDPNYNHHLTYRKQYSNVDGQWISTLWALIMDTLLLTLFILQHSLMTLAETKELFASLKLQTLQRTVYVIATSLVLQLLMKYWHFIPETAVWQFDTSGRSAWWFFCSFHAFAWTVIYVGTICMDVNELIGVKQIYYAIQNLPDPSIYKSRDLKRLYAHMRHPSFIGFLVILWITPIMSLDRLLLAVVLSAYMYIAWNTDNQDYFYQKQQYSKKCNQLNYSY